jgi:hypothetical protein
LLNDRFSLCYGDRCPTTNIYRLLKIPIALGILKQVKNTSGIKGQDRDRHESE